MSIGLPSDYRFTQEDADRAEDLEWLEFGDNPREPTAEEQEFARWVYRARRFKNRFGEWPTVHELNRAEAEQRKREEKELAAHATQRTK